MKPKLLKGYRWLKTGAMPKIGDKQYEAESRYTTLDDDHVQFGRVNRFELICRKIAPIRKRRKKSNG